jgi:hypothetical protein
MKIAKTIMSIILCVAILATTGIAFYNNYTQNRAGRYTATTTISDAEREWILERFGREYGSIEEYIATVQSYARKNFQYHHGKKVLFQYFDFDDIEQDDRIYGICFDFAVLFKHITLVLDEEGLLPMKGFKVYEVDIAYEDFFKPHHSYNVISLSDGTSYYLDLTLSVSRVEKKMEPNEDYEIFTCSIKNYCARYKERLLNYH